MSKLLILSILLVQTSLAAAVSRDDFGEGQVLLVPFFTVENGWDTYINVTQAYDRHNILKVRVLEGENGTVVNTFNVYTRTAENLRVAIGRDASDEAFLRIAEGACVISDSGVYGSVGTDFALAARTGMVEIYQVGYYLQNSVEALSCGELAARWQSDGEWASDPLDGLRARSTTVTGHFDLVNVDKGLSSEHAATGLKDFTATIAHTAPGDLISPSLDDADPIARLPNGDEIEPDSSEGIDAIALLLSTRIGRMTNDVVTSAKIGASTDWVVTFPLRGYKNYGSIEFDINGATQTCNRYAPTTHETGQTGGRFSGPWRAWGGGRYAGSGIVDIDPEPQVPYSPFLCNTVNVLAFNEKPSLFLPEGSELLTVIGSFVTPDAPSSTVTYGFGDGGSYSFTDVPAPVDAIGRPVLAFRATAFINDRLEEGTVLANYMIVKPHKIE